MADRWMQWLRVVMMVVAVAGVIVALEYAQRGIAMWFWVAVLGVGFVGLLVTYRITQRRIRREKSAAEADERRRARRRRKR